MSREYRGAGFWGEDLEKEYNKSERSWAHAIVMCVGALIGLVGGIISGALVVLLR